MDSEDFFHESLDLKFINWKIRNVFSLPERADYSIQSPSFSFADATWELRMYPYGSTDDTEGYIDFSIKRMKYRIPNQNITFKFYIQTKREKEFKSYSSSQCWKPDCDEWIVERFLKISNLIQNKSVIAPKGVLTVFCEIQTKKVAGIDMYSQTEAIVLKYEPISQKSRKTSYLPESNCKAPSVDKMVRDYKELYLNQEDCDVTITVKEQVFKAHSAVLRGRSPVFCSTFRSGMKEKTTGVIDIQDCDPCSFSDFLLFLYCGHVEELTTEKVFSLFTTADKYDVQDLRWECLELIKKNLSVDTFCETVTLALQHLEKDLIDLTTRFFAKHLQEIIVTVKWQTFVVENPIQSNEIMIKSLVSNKK